MKASRKHCRSCGELGHDIRTCPKDPRSYLKCIHCKGTFPRTNFKSYIPCRKDGYVETKHSKLCLDCQKARGYRCRACGELGHQSPKCPRVPNGTYPCVKCNKFLDESAFWFVNGERQSSCRRCNRAYQNNLRRTDIRYYFAKMVSEGRKTMGKRGLKSDIDVQFMIALLDQQNHNCYYTNIMMSMEPGTWAISIDRKDASIGYLKENAVLCCRLVNYMKCDMTPEQFVTLCKLVVTKQESRDSAQKKGDVP